MAKSIDLNNLQFDWRNYYNTPSDLHATYSTQFSYNGTPYNFFSSDFINKGLTYGDQTAVAKYFLDTNNQNEFFKNAIPVDLAGVSWYGDWLKDKVGTSTSGYLVPVDKSPTFDQLGFAQYKSSDIGTVLGIGTQDGDYGYITTSPGGKYKYGYIDPSGTEHNVYYNITYTPGKSFLGNVLGDFGQSISNVFNSTLSSINSIGPVGKLALAVAAPEAAAVLASANAGQAAAQGDWENAALNAGAAYMLSNSGGGTDAAAATPESSVDYYGGNYAGTEASSFLTPEQLAQYGSAAAPATAEAITNEIAANQPTTSPTVAPESQIDYTAGNYSGTEAASFLTPDEIANYGPITDAEMTAAKSASASTGWTFKQALDAVRAGLLVNALTGDPLNLSGDKNINAGNGTGVSSGSAGFPIVPIPSEWKSPTYTTSPVTNVTFEDLFPGVSLQGTQWAGLQNAQPNMTFNDIFASGLQSTPMGTPVNIADIVGNIVGQSTKS